MERNIALRLAYDGTNYHGWQAQTGRKEEQLTIQAIIATALKQICNHPIKLHGAGRTDGGVHAADMVCNFLTTSTIAITNLHRAINCNIPADIRIMQAYETPLDFHSRYTPSVKTYCYTIEHNSLVPNPLLSRYAWHTPLKLDPQELSSILAPLIGQHDFIAFQGKRPTTTSTLREITAIEVNHAQPNLIQIRISGRGFLKHMVRIIVGTVIEIVQGRINIQLNEILELRQRTKAGRTAPACGLLLEKIDYNA